ncbi:MAG: hypothetical protein WC119_01540 [Synergistaceae bacterium]
MKIYKLSVKDRLQKRFAQQDKKEDQYTVRKMLSDLKLWEDFLGINFENEESSPSISRNNEF